MRVPGYRTTRVTFPEHRIRRIARYKCTCGARFKRTETETWTENPFHQWQGREHELNAAAAEKCIARLAKKECPKCKAICKPV